MHIKKIPEATRDPGVEQGIGFARVVQRSSFVNKAYVPLSVFAFKFLLVHHMGENEKC